MLLVFFTEEFSHQKVLSFLFLVRGCYNIALKPKTPQLVPGERWLRRAGILLIIGFSASVGFRFIAKRYTP